MSALGDERDGTPGQVFTEFFERVEVRVGSEHVEATVLDHRFHFGLDLLALGADLGKSGGEHDGELGFGPHGILEDRKGVVDQDRHQVQHAHHLGERCRTWPAGDLGAVRIDVVDRCSPLFGPRRDLLRQGAVGSPGGVGCTHDSNPFGMEEGVQIEGSEADRASRDVERAGAGRSRPPFSGHCSQLPSLVNGRLPTPATTAPLRLPNAPPGCRWAPDGFPAAPRCSRRFPAAPDAFDGSRRPRGPPGGDIPWRSDRAIHRIGHPRQCRSGNNLVTSGYSEL